MPSSLLGIDNKRIALDFDIAIAVKASNLEKKEIEKKENGQDSSPKAEMSPEEARNKMKAQIAAQYSLQLKAQS